MWGNVKCPSINCSRPNWQLRSLINRTINRCDSIWKQQSNLLLSPFCTKYIMIGNICKKSLYQSNTHLSSLRVPKILGFYIAKYVCMSFWKFIVSNEINRYQLYHIQQSFKSFHPFWLFSMATGSSGLLRLRMLKDIFQRWIIRNKISVISAIPSFTPFSMMTFSGD